MRQITQQFCIQRRGSDNDIDFVIDKGRLRGLQLAGMLGNLQEIFNKGIELPTITGISSEVGNHSFKQRVKKDMVVVYEQ